MAVLTSFRDPGGAVGDTYMDEQGEWHILVVYDDGSVTGVGSYNWGLINPLNTGSGNASTTITVLQALDARVTTVETALGADVLDCSFDMVVLLENQLL